MLRSLRTFPTFGKGWTRRVNDVRATALGMVGEEVATPEQVMTGAKAAKADLAQPVVSQGAATAATAGTASASAVIQQFKSSSRRIRRR